MHQNDLGIASLQDQVSPAEWQLRVDLAACYRLVAEFGWSDLVFTHISARLPDEPGEQAIEKIPGQLPKQDRFLINPYGLMFDEITASSLVRIDTAGNKLDDSPFAVNPAGFTIHSALHAARHDAACVLHVHSLNGVAVSAQKDGLLPLSQQSIFILGSLGYHDYEGVALSEAEKPRLVADLGAKRYLMLRNHGLLTVARSIPDAFLQMYLFESACTIQIRAQSGGGELVRIDDAIVAGARQQARDVTRAQGGMLAWPALLRRLERKDPSYRS